MERMKTPNEGPHSTLTKNFDLSKRTAQVYMRWAREADLSGDVGQVPYHSMRQMTGHTERDRERRQSPQHRAYRRGLRDVARDEREHRLPECRLVVSMRCAAGTQI
jgi:hypothetical protein